MLVHYGGRKKRQIRFSDKTHPALGIASSVIGVAVWAVLITLCIISYHAGGASGLAVGAFGILVLIGAVVGLVFAVKCYKKEDIYMLTPAMGTFLNGIMIIICTILYFMGAA